MSPAPKYSAQQQLEMVLEAAIQCIEDSSLLSFTMSAVAKTAGLSMGSVYKQVQCKEDLLIALAVEMFQHEREVFSKVMSLPLTTPETLIAFNLLDFHKISYYSFSEELETLVSSDSIIKRASPLWLQRMIDSSEAVGSLFYNLISQAVDSREVDQEGRDRDQLIMEIEVGGWALCRGYMQSVLRYQTRSASGPNTPLPFPLTTDDHLVRNTQRLLNTYQWQTPLTDSGIEKAARLLTEIGYR